MKTKAGSKAVKTLSRRMDELNKEMIELAMKLHKVSKNEGIESIVAQAERNRTEWESLNKQIATLVRIELFLPNLQTQSAGMSKE